MGLVLEQTKVMGHFSTELRQESFYISTAEREKMFLYPRDDFKAGGQAEFLLEDIPKIRACLNAIEKEQKERKRRDG